MKHGVITQSMVLSHEIWRDHAKQDFVMQNMAFYMKHSVITESMVLHVSHET